MLNRRPPDMAKEYEDPRYLDTRRVRMLQRLNKIDLFAIPQLTFPSLHRHFQAPEVNECGCLKLFDCLPGSCQKRKQKGLMSKV